MKSSIALFFLLLTSILMHGQTTEQLHTQAKTHIEAKNYTLAIPLLEEAAEQGHDPSNFQLALIYGIGTGVNQDFEKALSYSLRCAENNDEACMMLVINAYDEGLGTEKNRIKMLDWSIRLGSLELPANAIISFYITSTRLKLARMYNSGKEVNYDPAKSYMWYLLYQEGKTDLPADEQQAAMKEIKQMENQLTSKQRKAGRKTAKKLLGRPLRNLKNLHQVEQ